MLKSIRALKSSVRPDVPTPSEASAMENGEDPTTLHGLILRAARLWPQNGITFKDQGWDQESTLMSYAHLLKEAQVENPVKSPVLIITDCEKTNAAKLKAQGTVAQGQCVVLYFDTHRNNVIWFWSTVLAGGVPVMLSPLSNNEITLAGELNNVVKLFGSPTVLTTKTLAKLFVLHDSLTTVTVEVVEGTKLETDLATVTEAGPSSKEDELAMVLFTSGSTGFAKGIEYTGAQLVISSRLKCKFHNMDSNKTFMSWVSKYQCL